VPWSAIQFAGQDGNEFSAPQGHFPKINAIYVLTSSIETQVSTAGRDKI
jgi:hypothetical protein